MTPILSSLCCCDGVGVCCHDEGVTDECSDLTQPDCLAIGGLWHSGSCAGYDCNPNFLCPTSCPDCPDMYTVSASWSATCVVFSDPDDLLPTSWSKSIVVARTNSECGWTGGGSQPSDNPDFDCEFSASITCSQVSNRWRAHSFANRFCMCPVPPYTSVCDFATSYLPVGADLPSCPVIGTYNPTCDDNPSEFACYNCIVTVG